MIILELLFATKNIFIVLLASSILFTILKIGGVINWVWAWVLSPLWIGASAIGIMVGIIYLIAKGSN